MSFMNTSHDTSKLTWTDRKYISDLESLLAGIVAEQRRRESKMWGMVRLGGSPVPEKTDTSSKASDDSADTVEQATDDKLVALAAEYQKMIEDKVREAAARQ